jgi:hypothetical protein
VLRLASLLWRLRRATAIETQLLEIQAEALRKGGRFADGPKYGSGGAMLKAPRGGMVERRPGKMMDGAIWRYCPLGLVIERVPRI